MVCYYYAMFLNEFLIFRCLKWLGGESKSGVTFCKQESFELEGSKGEANFVIRWPFSKSAGYVKILDMKGGAVNYNEEDNSRWKTIQTFECRGLELVSWIPGPDFCAESTGGTSFAVIDLAESDWADYDDNHDMAVSITNLESQIEKSKS
jgi:hypothetical protein